MTDHHSPFGSGPAPIGLRDDIIRLQQEEEAALLRAESILAGRGRFDRILRKNNCDHLVVKEPIAGIMHKERP